MLSDLRHWKHHILSECQFKSSRSQGPGGQHVNKTESKVELVWNLNESQYFSDIKKNLLRQKLKTRLTKDNRLILSCEETRSQFRNKDLVIRKFIELIDSGLTITKKRKPTKPSRAANEKRIRNKKLRSEIKKGRKLF